ncbi:uncharacterized protein H6S33_011833 [Morchella sextelata]|uniref:uncharacterized protein n=1 Tax=Morchella sextelata TaxID=1174677 RepID=UPI001D059E02|nr:uncharacterized protein H6S33_011833 [Morchella sextelata]KAH0610306.1 hypothetical protein H6S33_011833 [Morchella sextelata]
MNSPHPHQAQLTMLTTHIHQLWKTYDTLKTLADTFSAPVPDPSVWKLLTGVPVTSLDMEVAEWERKWREVAQSMEEVVAEIRAWEERVGVLLM